MLVGRTIVYALLTAILLALYAAVSAAAGLALPGAEDTLGRLLAAALVAVAFAPLRGLLQRKIGRRLFGDRAEPYAALRRLSREPGAPVNPGRHSGDAGKLGG